MTLKSHSLNIQTVVVATTVGAITVLGLYLYQKKRKNAVPTEWEPVGKVKGLYMYPLKSGRRIELRTADCDEFGVQLKTKSGFQLRDRCLVVYKEGNKEVKTARTYPNMILIEVTADDHDHFIVNAPGMKTLRINVPSLNSNNSDEIESWENEKIFTIDCGDDAAQWFSKYILGKTFGLRLGFHDALSLHKRNIEKTHKHFIKIYPHLESSSTGLYTDLSSFMVMNQSSVDELNSRIPGSSITVHNFRPNILVEGSSAFAEDNWYWIKIGDVILRTLKPCVRCSLTTIDPERAIKSANHEPLTTLKTYRKVRDLTKIELEGDSPIMGLNMGYQQGGLIHVGDTVYLGK